MNDIIKRLENRFERDEAKTKALETLKELIHSSIETHHMLIKIASEEPATFLKHADMFHRHLQIMDEQTEKFGKLEEFIERM